MFLCCTDSHILLVILQNLKRSHDSRSTHPNLAVGLICDARNSTRQYRSGSVIWSSHNEVHSFQRYDWLSYIVVKRWIWPVTLIFEYDLECQDAQACHISRSKFIWWKVIVWRIQQIQYTHTEDWLLYLDTKVVGIQYMRQQVWPLTNDFWKQKGVTALYRGVSSQKHWPRRVKKSKGKESNFIVRLLLQRLLPITFLPFIPISISSIFNQDFILAHSLIYYGRPT